MALLTLTAGQILARLLAAKQTQDPTLDVSVGSDAAIDAFAQALRLAAQQARDNEIADGILPSTAIGTMLDRHAETYLGASARLGATAWTGTIRVTCTSAPATASIGDQLTASDGTTYVLKAGNVFGAPASADLKAQSVTLGTVANKANGTILTYVSPPVGISSSATIQSTTVSARDEETDADLRERVLEKTSGRPGSGNCSDYVLWAKDNDATGVTTEVDDCFVYPRWGDTVYPAARGTVVVVPLGPVASRVLSAGDINLIQAYIDTVRPCGVEVTVQSPITAGSTVDCRMTVHPKAGYEPYWSGTLTTDAGSTTTQINTTTNPITAGVAAGQFIQIPTGAAATWEYVEVASVEATHIHLVSAVTVAPNAGLTIYPGGPLYVPIVVKVGLLFASLGPSRSSDPTVSQRYPDPDTVHPPELFLAALTHAVMDATGVENVAWTAPAADTTNTIALGADPVLITLGPASWIAWN